MSIPTYVVVLLVVIAIASLVAATGVCWLIQDILKRRAESEARRKERVKKELKDAFEAAVQKITEKVANLFPGAWVRKWPDSATCGIVATNLSVKIEQDFHGGLAVSIADLTGTGRVITGPSAVKIACEYIDKWFSSAKAS